MPDSHNLITRQIGWVLLLLVVVVVVEIFCCWFFFLIYLHVLGGMQKRGASGRMGVTSYPIVVFQVSEFYVVLSKHENQRV